jgi:hypothetical protein
VFYTLILKRRLLILSIACIKTTYVPFGPQLYFTLFIWNIRFIFHEVPLEFLNYGFLSLLNSLRNAVASLILCHVMLTGFTGHLWFTSNTTIHAFPSLLVWKKAFPFHESFLKSPSFRIHNLNHAIPFLSLFSEHYLQLVSPRIRSRLSGDNAFIPHFFRHIWIFLHWF